MLEKGVKRMDVFIDEVEAQLAERLTGGKVFYVYDGGQHGLITSTTDPKRGGYFIR